MTAATVVLKLTVVAFAGIVTEDGTLAAVLLLERSTNMPPVGAAEASVTVQASVPLLLIEALEHDRPLSAGTLCAPVPISSMVKDDADTELSVITS